MIRSAWIRISLSCWIRIRFQVYKLLLNFEEFFYRYVFLPFFLMKRKSTDPQDKRIRVRVPLKKLLFNSQKRLDPDLDLDLQVEKCWIWIHIKSMRIRNPGSYTLQNMTV
jgi:hypothetical protein